MHTVRRAFAEAAAVLLPVECSGCGLPGSSVCGVCESALQGDVIRRSLDGVPVGSACAYAGEAARIISAFKDSGRIDASRALAGALRRAVVASLGDDGPSAVLAVPIPGSREAFRRRGYDPLRVLAKRAGIPTHQILRLSRRVADQAELDARQRRENRAGALVARRRIDGRAVLLLDDVVTTGATLADAIDAIRGAGGTVVGAATIAATPLRRAVPRGLPVGSAPIGRRNAKPRGPDPEVGHPVLSNSKTSLGNPDASGLGS